MTSIDIDEVCCKQLSLGLENEQNPNSVRIICSDVMKVNGIDGKFDIVTMIGSSRLESGLYDEIISKAISLLKPNGRLYYQSLDKQELKAMFEQICEKVGVKIERFFSDKIWR